MRRRPAHSVAPRVRACGLRGAGRRLLQCRARAVPRAAAPRVRVYSNSRNPAAPSSEITADKRYQRFNSILGKGARSPAPRRLLLLLLRACGRLKRLESGPGTRCERCHRSWRVRSCLTLRAAPHCAPAPAHRTGVQDRIQGSAAALSPASRARARARPPALSLLPALSRRQTDPAPRPRARRTPQGYDCDQGIEVAWNKLNTERMEKQEAQRLLEEISILKRLKHRRILTFHKSYEEARRRSPPSLPALALECVRPQVLARPLVGRGACPRARGAPRQTPCRAPRAPPPRSSPGRKCELHDGAHDLRHTQAVRLPTLSSRP